MEHLHSYAPPCMQHECVYLNIEKIHVFKLQRSVFECIGVSNFYGNAIGVAASAARHITDHIGATRFFNIFFISIFEFLSLNFHVRTYICII